MRTKPKQNKPKAKKPKPNLHGPNSPTPKTKILFYDQDDDEPGEIVSTKHQYANSEN